MKNIVNGFVKIVLVGIIVFKVVEKKREFEEYGFPRQYCSLCKHRGKAMFYDLLSIITKSDINCKECSECLKICRLCDGRYKLFSSEEDYKEHLEKEG